jgi:hypothetical protein
MKSFSRNLAAVLVATVMVLLTASRPARGEGGASVSSQTLLVFLSSTSNDTHRTFLLLPQGAEKEPVKPASIRTLIVTNLRSPNDDKTVLERFARELPPGETHLALDLPEGILAVDVHQPANLSLSGLKELVNKSNMEAFAAYQFKEPGRALYSLLYTEFEAVTKAAHVAGTVIGEIDSAGNYKPLR